MTWLYMTRVYIKFKIICIALFTIQSDAQMSFICHIHNYTEYNQQWNVFSAFNPSTHLEQWAVDAVAPGEQLGVRCLAQGSHLSRGQFLPETGFEPVTSGFKSNTLSIRPRLPPIVGKMWLILYILWGRGLKLAARGPIEARRMIFCGPLLDIKV